MVKQIFVDFLLDLLVSFAVYQAPYQKTSHTAIEISWTKIVLFRCVLEWRLVREQLVAILHHRLELEILFAREFPVPISTATDLEYVWQIWPTRSFLPVGNLSVAPGNIAVVFTLDELGEEVFVAPLEKVVAERLLQFKVVLVCGRRPIQGRVLRFKHRMKLS